MTEVFVTLLSLFCRKGPAAQLAQSAWCLGYEWDNGGVAF